jgi:hypothetical protein
MIIFAKKTINTKRIAANYSLEELNIVIDHAFLFPSFNFKFETKDFESH